MANNGKLVKQNSDVSRDGNFRCGYLINNLDKYESRWKCPFCDGIIKEPYQLTECGHRVCRGCFENRVATMNSEELRSCPKEDCDEKFGKTNYMADRAFKKELDFLQVTCVYKTNGNCSWSGHLKFYQEHLDDKHTNHECELCKETFLSYQALSEHKGTRCPYFFKQCPLMPYCIEEMIPNEQFSEHLLSEKHQETLALILTGRVSVEQSNDTENNMESSSADEELEKKIGEKISETGENIHRLTENIVETSREFIKLNELNQVTGEELNQFQTAINERNTILNNLQIKQQQIQKEIDSVKQMLDENEYVSTDGTCIWRVDHVAERMSDAQSERQPSIFSPIFYSAPNGYKMRARLYLHGDGSARRTHISLFFLLLKGDYDALLTWPFNHKVTFCLFDQTGNNRHIIDSFRPDVKSNSFQRPTAATNVASGIPKFFPLPMIQQDDNSYVRDDTLFIKIMVDLQETPKLILPFLLTLNPGLPYHVQQTLVNQEKAKQQTNPLSSNTTTLLDTCS